MTDFISSASFPIYTNQKFVYVPITFDGSAGGGLAGTAVPVVSAAGGLFIVRSMFIVSSGLTAGAGATLALETTSKANAFIGATLASDLGLLKTWVATSGNTASEGLMPASMRDHLCLDIIITPAVDDITAGALNFYIRYDTIVPS